MFSFGITKYFSENIIIKCTAEPTLLCTFSVVSLFRNQVHSRTDPIVQKTNALILLHFSSPKAFASSLPMRNL